MKCEICGIEINRSAYMHANLCHNSECFHKHFWNAKVELIDHPNSVRIDGTHYFIGTRTTHPSMRGFGGRKFIIEFFVGHKITTTNLWCQGKIPDEYRTLLPDNAQFVQEVFS